MSKMTKQQRESQEWAKGALLKIFGDQLKAGKKPVIKTVLKHVSASGMMREITLLTAHEGEVVNLNQYACALLGYKCGKHDGVKIGGCGMDMGFALVYNLGAALFGCRGEHAKEYGLANEDGGYAFRHEWA